MKLSKGIGEIQVQELKHIWQPPDIYDEVHDNNIWLVYGRKGSGKSTLVNYLGTEKEQSHVIIIRPRQTNLFKRALSAIKSSSDEDRIIEESFANTIDFILTTRIIRDLVESNKYYKPGSPQEIMYNFMQQHDLMEGSVLRKAINLFSTAGKLKIVPDVDSAIKTIEGGVDYDDAKEALMEYSVEINKSIVLCIDDIDEIGFSFSRFDRLFVNGLLILMVRSNTNYLENQSKIRIVLTIPSELYFHSTLWGGDWVSGKAECLIWENKEHIQELVNKRIALELGIKKNNPRFKTDIYSVDTRQTWNRVFPTTIGNKFGKSEQAFEYLLRHTFYTPRHILDLCDRIISNVVDNGNGKSQKDIEKITNGISVTAWSKIFQDSVQDFAEVAAVNIRDLFGEIYEGLDDVLKAFRSRPHIWNRSQLLNYIVEADLQLVRPDKEQIFQGESLVNALHRIGFIGLATRDMAASAQGTHKYNVKFSFLEKTVYQGGWELAVVSPLFYDTYDIRSIDNTVINPHENLILTTKSLHHIMNYNSSTNT